MPIPTWIGHTAACRRRQAVETVDAGLGRIADAIERAAARCWSPPTTGNCEMMRDPVTGGPHTAHTTNPVPLLLIGARNRALMTQGRLATSRRRCSNSWTCRSRRR